MATRQVNTHKHYSHLGKEDDKEKTNCKVLWLNIRSSCTKSKLAEVHCSHTAQQGLTRPATPRGPHKSQMLVSYTKICILYQVGLQV